MRAARSTALTAEAPRAMFLCTSVASGCSIRALAPAEHLCWYAQSLCHACCCLLSWPPRSLQHTPSRLLELSSGALSAPNCAKCIALRLCCSCPLQCGRASCHAACCQLLVVRCYSNAALSPCSPRRHHLLDLWAAASCIVGPRAWCARHAVLLDLQFEKSAKQACEYRLARCYTHATLQGNPRCRSRAAVARTSAFQRERQRGRTLASSPNCVSAQLRVVVFSTVLHL